MFPYEFNEHKLKSVFQAEGQNPVFQAESYNPVLQAECYNPEINAECCNPDIKADAYPFQPMPKEERKDDLPNSDRLVIV